MPRRRNAPNQTKLVRDYLHEHGSITNAEAKARYDCISLSVIIARLRNKGEHIQNYWLKDYTDRIYVRYKIYHPINLGKYGDVDYQPKPKKYMPKSL